MWEVAKGCEESSRGGWGWSVWSGWEEDAGATLGQKWGSLLPLISYIHKSVLSLMSLLRSDISLPPHAVVLQASLRVSGLWNSCSQPVVWRSLALGRSHPGWAVGLSPVHVCVPLPKPFLFQMPCVCTVAMASFHLAYAWVTRSWSSICSGNWYIYLQFLFSFFSFVFLWNSHHSVWDDTRSPWVILGWPCDWLLSLLRPAPFSSVFGPQWASARSSSPGAEQRWCRPGWKPGCFLPRDGVECLHQCWMSTHYLCDFEPTIWPV